MTDVVSLAGLPVRAVLDGELVALDADGKPDFPPLCESVLQRRSSIPLTFMAFDVLSVEGGERHRAAVLRPAVHSRRPAA
jgi:ATP-dependent DNA ligase